MTWDEPLAQARAHGGVGDHTANGHGFRFAAAASPPASALDETGANGSRLAGVIVPTHNDGSNIGALLERLLAEPTVGEVVVIASECDDQTVPTVLEIANERKGHVRLYLEDNRSGKFSAVNFGVRETTMPIVVLVSGDVLPEPGAVTRLVQALHAEGAGLAGGRPMPLNSDDTGVGYAVQLLWRLHHRLALHQPKLGEMMAIRAEALVTLPATSVDEACFQALLEASGWSSIYVPDAVVVNRGPTTIRDFLKQRRQVHTGHLWLRARQHYTVPSLRTGLLVQELWQDLVQDRARLRPVHLAWTAGAAAMEAGARLLARFDYLRKKENCTWDMVETTKGPTSGPVPAHRRDPDGKDSLPLESSAGSRRR